MPTSGASSRTALMTTSWCSRRRPGSSAASPPRAVRLFLDVADQLQLRVLGLQPRDLPLLLGDLVGERVGWLALRPALLRLEVGECTLLTQTAPLDQMRGIQALAAKQRADLARLRARVGLLQDPLLVLGGEEPPLGLRRHFRRGRLGTSNMVR